VVGPPTVRQCEVRSQARPADRATSLRHARYQARDRRLCAECAMDRNRPSRSSFDPWRCGLLCYSARDRTPIGPYSSKSRARAIFVWGGRASVRLG